MTPQLTSFIEHAPIDAVLAMLATVPRILLAKAAERVVPWGTKLGIFIGSICTGIALGYVARQFPAAEKWAPLVALAAGFLAQDLVMKFAAVGRAAADRLADEAEDTLDRFRPRKRNDNDHE